MSSGSPSNPAHAVGLNHLTNMLRVEASQTSALELTEVSDKATV